MDFREFTFRNCLENILRPLASSTSAARSGCSESFRPLSEAFGAPVSGPIPIFRTVSPRTPVNKGMKKDRGAPWGFEVPPSG